MAASGTTIGYGNLFYHSTDGTTFTSMAEVIDINGPGLAADAVETTHTESTNGWREFIGGLKDAGEITVTCNFRPDNASNDTLRGYIGSLEYYRIAWVGLTERVTCQGILTGYSPQAPLGDKMTVDLTIKLSGEPTFAANA